MLSTQRFFSRRAAGRVHGVGGSGKRAGGKSFRARQLRLERLEERTVLSGGVVLTLIGDGYSAMYDSFLQPGPVPGQDRIVVAGSAGDWGSYRSDFAVLRYQADGTLDPSFGGGDGVVTTAFGGSSNDRAYAAALHPEGVFVLGGVTQTYAKGYDWALARYNPDGSLDQTFGSRGKLKTDFGAYQEWVTDVAVDFQGRVLAAGKVSNVEIVRYTASGALDTSFGGSGVVVTGFTGPVSTECVNDQIYVTGRKSFIDGEPHFPGNLARYNSNGTLDTGFGNAGIVDCPNFWIADQDVGDLVVQEGGKILVLGQTNTPSGDALALLRVNTDGSLDGSFGQNGLVVLEQTSVPPDPGSMFRDLAIQPDGKIVLAGDNRTYPSYAGTGFAVVRLNADGCPDADFGQNGYVFTPVGDGGVWGRSVVIHSDGKIVVSGNATVAGQGMVALARYNPDGTLDETFGEPAPPPPGITVTQTSGLETSEDGGTASFSVVLDSQPTADVTIPVSSDDSTEGTASVSSLTFTAANWDTPQTVIVTGVDDLDADGNVAYTVNLGPAAGASEYAGIDPADVALTNLDNEGQSNVFVSEDVPKTIADPHPVKGVKPVTSQLVIASTAITVDLIDVDLTIAHASMSDLTVTLKSPSNTTADLIYDGADWNLVDPAAFSLESLDGTWVLTVTDTVKNGISGTLTAWSMTVTPLGGAAASQGETLTAADLFFLDLALNSDKDKTDPLDTQAADELALMLVE